MKPSYSSFLVVALLAACTVARDNRAGDHQATLPGPTARDTLDILRVYHLNIADKGDLDALKDTWSEDARWLNAFGRVFHGRDTILGWLDYLYKNPGYAVSHVTRQDDPEIRFLRPDVAVIHEYHERAGQVINDQVTPTRKINSTYILTRENGTWLIRDKVTMDERERSN